MKEVYRSGFARWSVAAFSMSTALAAATALSAARGLTEAVVFAIAGLAALWFVVRALRGGLVLTEQELVIGGLLRSLRVPVHQVKGLVYAFDAKSWQGIVPGRRCYVELHDGRRHAVLLLSPMNWVSKRDQARLDRINRSLVERRSGGR